MAVYAVSNGVDCRTCFSGLQKQRGCNEPIDRKIKVGRFESYRCPRVYLKGEVFNYIDAYEFYQKGMLPHEGGYLKQPMKFMQAMRIIDAVLAENGGE